MSDNHEFFDEQGRGRMREYSIDDRDAEYEDRQRIARIVMIAITVVALVAVVLLIYVFNTSQPHSATIMGLVTSIVTLTCLALFGILQVRNGLVDRHERSKGEVALRYGRSVDFDITQDEYLKPEEEVQPQPSE